MSDKKIKVTLIKSKFGRLHNHQQCLSALGLRKIHQSCIVDDTPSNRGLINKISYLLKIEEAY